MKTKPFGLKIATEKATIAMKEGKAPVSVILSNLFVLQKISEFPKSLDSIFFTVARYNPNETEKKLLVKLMDSLKQPSVNQQELLEKAFESEWVVKKSPPTNVSTKQGAFAKKKTQAKSPIHKPTVVIKKSKI